ncbi:MAG: hypothetical protein IJ518_05175 [Clostridia bacterium]|nr:hypothetical protein [Clostridia bacterium]
MKRIVAMLCVCVLLLCTTACDTSLDDIFDEYEVYYDKGIAALEQGDYLTAYTNLSAYVAVCDNLDAAETLEKLVFVPTEAATQLEENTVSRYTYTYDKNGNLLEQKQAFADTSLTTAYTYNEKGQLVTIREETAADMTFTTTYAYDEAGNRTEKKVDRDGHVTTFRYTYDSENRCTSIKQTDADGTTFLTTYRYDDKGNTTFERVDYADESWHERHFTYNADGKPSQETGSDFTGGSYETLYTYDGAGNLLSHGDFTYTYDEAGRLTMETQSGGSIIEYTYDEDGNVLTEHTTHTTGGEYFVTYTYDEKGNRLSLTYNNGEARTFTYDEYGNKTSESYTSVAGQKYLWQYVWALHYYPDGVPEEVEEIRLRAVNMQAVM